MKETLLIQQQLPSINVDESSTPLFFSIIDFIYACLFLSFHNILIFGIEMYDVIHSFFLFSFFFIFFVVVLIRVVNGLTSLGPNPART